MADDKLRATPAARKLADDLGINLYDISGSGANGRVHKEDVETFKDTFLVKYTDIVFACKSEGFVSISNIITLTQ